MKGSEFDDMRRVLVEIEADQRDRPADAIDTNQLREQYEVLGFAAPFCLVKRKSDGVRGFLNFHHDPRYYYGFTPEGK